MEYYRLEIALPEDVKVERASAILGLRADPSRSQDGNIWAVEDEEQMDQSRDFIGRYCRSVRRGLPGLTSIGIEAEAISIWLLYEYDQQCNMEFTPSELQVMGDLGITFCISCWAK